MRGTDAPADADAERAELLRVLFSAPGVGEVDILGEHPKGGYRARVELSQSELDPFVAHLEARGWKSVV